MTTVEKTLLILASFSIRAQFIDKALLYAECGHRLFPQNTALYELYGLTLLHVGNYEALAAHLEQAGHQTGNIAYLRIRLAILTGQDDKSELVRQYLALRKRG